MKVELLWIEGCPNHVEARRTLERVLAARGLDARDIRLVRVDDESAAAARFPGSPTIRVEGRDIEPGFREPDACSLACRVYATPSGLRGVPPVEWIEDAVDRALRRGSEPAP